MTDTLDIGDVSSPDFAEVFIKRNGERVILKAYRNTNRCPGSVKGLISVARRDYKEATQLGTADYAPDDAAWFRMLRNLLDAAIPDILPREADVLSGDEDKAVAILRELEWWPKAEEEPDQGEAKGEESSTTAPSSPD